MTNVFDLIFGVRDKTDTHIVNNQNFTITTTSNVTKNPTWVARYPNADVAYPEIINAALYAIGSTDNNVGSPTTHHHDMTVLVQAGAWPIAQHESAGTYVRVSTTTVMDAVGMICFKSSGTLDNVFIEIFRENADLSATRVFSANIAATITTSTQYIEVPITGGLIVQEGERYLVRLRNSSSVATNVNVTGVDTLVGTFGQEVFYTSGSSLTAQTSYSAAETATAKSIIGTMVWSIMAATSIPASDQSFSDDFNRINLGGLWRTKSQTTTDAVAITGQKAAYNGTTNGNENAVFIRPTTSDACRVDGTFHEVSATPCGLILHANQDLSQIVYLRVTDSGAAIYTGAYDSLTSRATFTIDGNNARWSLYYEPASNQYTVLKDGVALGSPWVDSGNVVVQGDGYRYGGLRLERASSVNSGTIDDWTLRDYAP